MRYELNFDEDKVNDIEAIGDDSVLDLKDCCKIMNGQQYIIDEQKIAIDEMITDYKNLEKENEQLKIANAKWLDKALQDKQIRYSNANCKELTKKYLQLKEENRELRRLFEEMKQPITINLKEEDEKELRKLLGLIDDE